MMAAMVVPPGCRSMSSTVAVFEALLCACFAARLAFEALPSFETPVAFRAAVDLLAPILACLTGDDHVVSVDDNRRRPIKLSNARCNLPDLPLRMRPCIARIGLKAGDRNICDLQFSRDRMLSI